jgi:NADPH-dependent 7-cyano-7-deazaguanine reductase QueF
MNIKEIKETYGEEIYFSEINLDFLLYYIEKFINKNIFENKSVNESIIEELKIEENEKPKNLKVFIYF